MFLKTLVPNSSYCKHLTLWRNTAGAGAGTNFRFCFRNFGSSSVVGLLPQEMMISRGAYKILAPPSASLCSFSATNACRSIGFSSINNRNDRNNTFGESTSIQSVRSISTSSQLCRARKGTRERKEKLKKKNKKPEIIKKTFIQRVMEKKANIAHTLQRPPDNTNLPAPLDDVYFYERFQDKIWSFAEAVENHREYHHPTMRNYPKSAVLVRIDMDFVYPNRPNKMMDTWKAIIEMKKPFTLPGMAIPRILAFCINDTDYINEVVKAGADTAGSHELIKSIQEGHISTNDYEHVIAHPLMVLELSAIRGLLKRKFPNVKSKTVDVDLNSVVQRLKTGIKLHVQSTDREPDFAWIEAPIGKLDMSTDDLEANFMSILKDTLPRRVTGKPPSQFIVQCSLKTPYSTEKFILDKEYYISLCDSQTGSRSTDKNVDEPLTLRDEEDESVEKSSPSTQPT